MSEAAPTRRAKYFRLAFLIVLLVAAGVAWSEWSRSSPCFGWLRDSMEAARVERLRSAAVPPCRSASWTNVPLGRGVRLEVPSCFQHEVGDSGAVLVDEASGTVIAVSLYGGDTSKWSGAAVPTYGWEPCRDHGREDIYCNVQRVVVAGDAVTFRSRLVVAPRSAILLQTMVPGYLDGTSHDEAIREILTDVALRSSPAKNESEAEDVRGIDGVRSWLASAEIRFMMMAVATQGR